MERAAKIGVLYWPTSNQLLGGKGVGSHVNFGGDYDGGHDNHIHVSFGWTRAGTPAKFMGATYVAQSGLTVAPIAGTKVGNLDSAQLAAATIKGNSSFVRISFSISSSSTCILFASAIFENINISTLSNQWTLNIPLVSLP